MIGIILVAIVVSLLVIKPWVTKTIEPVNTGEETQTNVKEDEPEPDDFAGKVNEEGEFKLNVPQVKVLKVFQEKYEGITLGQPYKELREFLGEPDQKDSYKVLTYYTWNLDDGGNTIIKVSINNESGAVSEKTLILNSNRDLGYQISKELETEIDDISAKLQGVEVGMSFDEIVGILGEKYIEISRNDSGNKNYVWFDKNENSAELSFDKENLLLEKPIASYKGW